MSAKSGARQTWQDRVAAFLDDTTGSVSIEGVMCHLGGLETRRMPSRKAISTYLRDQGWRSQRDKRGHLAWHRPAAVRPDNWALEAEVSAGDRLMADGGFTCIPANAILIVERALYSEDLFVRCSEGKHMLDGQLGEHGRYVGFAKVAAL